MDLLPGWVEPALDAGQLVTWTFLVTVMTLRAFILGWRPPRRVRRLYHELLPVWLVLFELWILADGWRWYDAVFAVMGVYVWWIFKKFDDWTDDDERRSVTRGARGFVVRFGNRLRVRPSARVVAQEA